MLLFVPKFSSSDHYPLMSFDRLMFASSFDSHAGCTEELESIEKSHVLVVFAVGIAEFQSHGFDVRNIVAFAWAPQCNLWLQI